MFRNALQFGLCAVVNGFVVVKIMIIHVITSSWFTLPSLTPALTLPSAVLITSFLTSIARYQRSETRQYAS